MTDLAILDLGSGNLFSLKNSLKRSGVKVKIVRSLGLKDGFDALILPGVGSFSAAAKAIEENRRGLDQLGEDGIPILGICLGMQLFFDRSEEGSGRGLSFLEGDVVRLPQGLKVPHMGWNRVYIRASHPLLNDIEDESWVYFVHSYYPRPRDRSVVLAETDYGINFPSIIAKNSILGTQFHPEKSGKVGARILKNFLKFCRR